MNKLVSKNPVLRFKIQYYLGGTPKGGINLGIKSKEEIESNNNKERNLASHHFSKVFSDNEGIWDGIKHLVRGILHGYNGYLDPETLYQTGAPTILPGRTPTKVPSVRKVGTMLKNKLFLRGYNKSGVRISSVPIRLVPEGERITFFKNADGSRTPRYYDKKYGHWIDVEMQTPKTTSNVAKVVKAKPYSDPDVEVSVMKDYNTPEYNVPLYNYDDDVIIMNSAAALDDAIYNYDPGIIDVFKSGGRLISKNPVLRFKLGKKIVKALNSWGSNFGVYTFTPTNEQNIRKRTEEATKELLDNIREITPSEQGRYNRELALSGEDKYGNRVYKGRVLMGRRLEADLKTNDFRPYGGNYKYSGLVGDFNLNIENNENSARKLANYIASNIVSGGRNALLLIPYDTERSYGATNTKGPKNSVSNTLDILKNSEKTSSKTKTTANLTTISPKSKTKKWNGTFRGVAPGGKVIARDSDLSSVITEDLKNQLKSTGFFLDEDFKDVRSFQKALDYFLNREGWTSGKGLKIDNMWGDLTQKAFETALWKSKQPVVSVFGANNVPLIHFNEKPSFVNNSIPNIEPNIPKQPVVRQPSGYQIITPQHPYSTLNLKNALGKNNNFQGLVDLIWGDYANDDNEFNAVFSRDMKNMFSKYKDKQSWLDNLEAIEKALNISGNYRGKRAGDYGDLFRALAKYGGLNNYMNGYGQGGQLVSRNSIIRFKQGNKIKKFLKAGNLPTAPKAEDRFKNGVKDSIAYLGVPGKDNTYLGESVKRVTTPDNAAILRQILFRHYPHDNDTIYTEVPEHTKRLPILPPVNIIPRKGFSFAQTPEYEILKRRFNTAWNLAK